MRVAHNRLKTVAGEGENRKRLLLHKLHSLHYVYCVLLGQNQGQSKHGR